MILGENDRINSVRQLDWNDKGNINNLEELNSSKSIRLIDQQIQNLFSRKNQSITNLVLSCNQIGKNEEINWKLLPNHLQVCIISPRRGFEG